MGRYILRALALGMLLGAFAWLVTSRRTVSAALPAGSREAKKAASTDTNLDPRLAKAYRFERGGWVYVHLEGSPGDLGYQHGYLLAPEIADAFQAVKLVDTHETQRDWEFFRQAAREMLWPKIDPEYQEELKGIVEGLKARGVAMDLDDVVAVNAFEELPEYYVPWYNAQHKVANAPHIVSPGNCSAFVATGSYTRGGQIVMAHNAWTNYLDGERWRIVFDIAPQHGHHIFMDGYPGVMTSDDDFGVNDAGLMVTETTITQFEGWNPDGKPEFERSRKALQYAGSIDDYVRLMVEGNNGGYANDWLLGDRKTGEIAQFELGLKHHRVWRTKDGYFVGSNFASDPGLIADETKFDPQNATSSMNARRRRWEELMKQSRGKIDTTLAREFVADHFDVVEGKAQADERTLCGHVEDSSRGVPEWEWGNYFPGGAVQGKVMDSRMAQALSFGARRGHPCGSNFLAGKFLAAHPEYGWAQPSLRDMPAGPWELFRAGERK